MPVVFERFYRRDGGVTVEPPCHLQTKRRRPEAGGTLLGGFALRRWRLASAFAALFFALVAEQGLAYFAVHEETEVRE